MDVADVGMKEPRGNSARPRAETRLRGVRNARVEVAVRATRRNCETRGADAATYFPTADARAALRRAAGLT